MSGNWSALSRQPSSISAYTAYLTLAIVIIGPIRQIEAGGQTRSLAIADAAGMRDLQSTGRLATINADATLAAYTICDSRGVQPRSSMRSPNAAAFSDGCHIWVATLTDRHSADLTSDWADSWSPSWSPDGQTLAFYSDHGGHSRLWLWDRRTGRRRLAADVETRTRYGFEVPIWTPDGQSVVTKLQPDDAPNASEAADANAQSLALSPAPTVTILGGPGGRAEDGHQSSYSVVPNNLRADLGIIEIKTQQVRRLARGCRTTTVRLSPDGRTLLWLENHGRARNEIKYRHTLQVVDLVSGETQSLAKGIACGFSCAANWSPDNRWIAYASARIHSTRPEETSTLAEEELDAADLFVISSRQGGEPRRFSAGADRPISTDYVSPLWDCHSQNVYVVGHKRLWQANIATQTVKSIELPMELDARAILGAADGVRTWSPSGDDAVLQVLAVDPETQDQAFYRLSVDHSPPKLLLRAAKKFGGSFTRPVVAPDGDLVLFASESAFEPLDLWTARADFEHVRRLTTINPQLEPYEFGRSRVIAFRDSAGVPAKATVLLPANYVPGRRYPLVAWVYASEKGSLVPNTFGLVGDPAFNMQMLASRGYAVIWPDITVRVGSPLKDIATAVIPAIDEVVALGIADPERLAVMGQSHGGYTVLSLLVQTRRFKAAAMCSGFGDLTAFYGSMRSDGAPNWSLWLEHGGGAMGGPPWESPQRYVENSPIYYLDRVETPLLMEAGTADAAVLPFSDEVFVGLTRLSKDVTYLRYDGEGHVLVAFANIADYWSRLIEFFDRRLKPQPLTRIDEPAAR